MVSPILLPRILGIAWYYRKQWNRMVEVSEDGADMAPSYDVWLRCAERQVKNLRSSGTNVHKVYLDVDTLITWAARQGVNINKQTRTDYCNSVLANSLGFQSEV